MGTLKTLAALSTLTIAAGCAPAGNAPSDFSPNDVQPQSNVPTCDIASPTRTTLPASDNHAQPGAGFVVHFAIRTDIEDGQPVQLDVEGLAAPLSARAADGLALFDDVPLRTSGTTSVRALCTNAARTVGRSPQLAYSTEAAPVPADTGIGLSFLAPADAARFGAARDARPEVPGFQLRTVVIATTAADGTDIQLFVGNGGSYTATSRLHRVSFANVALPDGNTVELRAVAALPDRVVGTSSVYVSVDTTPPSAPTDVTTQVLSEACGAVRLAWRDAGDLMGDGSTERVARYEVRVSTTAVTESNFDEATAVEYLTPPGAMGDAASVEVAGLAQSAPYFFAVRAVDAAGNRGAIATTVSALCLGE